MGRGRGGVVRVSDGDKGGTEVGFVVSLAPERGDFRYLISPALGRGGGGWMGVLIWCRVLSRPLF